MDMFVENVLSEIKGRAAIVATDMIGSVTLQKLLPLASPAQVGGVLAELGGDSGAEFAAVSCDRCGAHVLESALRQAHRLTGDGGKAEDQEAASEAEGAAQGGCEVLEEQLLLLSNAVMDRLTEVARDTHGTFVARRIAMTLAGSLGHSDRKTGQQPRDSNPEPMDFDPPPSFSAVLERLADCLLEQSSLFLTHSLASPVLQAVLNATHKKCPALCQRLTQGMMQYLTTLGAAPGTSPLLVFLKDQTSSRLLETLITVSQKSQLRDLYKNHFRGHLVTLALHPIANFPVQRLVAAAANYKLFLKIFDELLEGLEAILAAGHMGVIVQLAESCVRKEERQSQMMQSLLEAFHCWDPPPRRQSCAPLLLSLLAWEVYYKTESTEGDTMGTQVHMCASFISANIMASLSQRPLSGVTYHGSCLVQSLLSYSDSSVLQVSLRALPPSDLLTLATDQSGSHVLEALVTSLTEKGRIKMLRRLKGVYVQMACSKFGSRALESVWSSASLRTRQGIAQELVGSKATLRSDQFGHHVFRNFALTHFLKRRDQWEELQTAQSKKRMMFSDILK
ncbi:NOP9 protein, partial [Amia calva]|nr:NOP9 protein [Amia calva]